MGIAPGILALALVGAGDGSKGGPAPIDYSVRVLEMDGPGWRQSLHARLRPVTRQGTASVWTAGRDVVGPLSEKALNRVQVPRVRAESGAVAHMSSGKTRAVATELTRHADGPFDHATSVAYTPEYETIREGFRTSIAGRRLDQGVLARVVFEDSRIAAVHRVTLSEAVAPKGDSAPAGEASPRIEVPEVVTGSLAGEWLIPAGEVLVLSLGTYTAADAEGKAIVRERLAIVEAVAGPTKPGRAGPGGLALAPVDGEIRPSSWSATRLGAGPSAKPNPMPMPTPPSRTLPQPRDADGAPVDLPKLPEEPAVPSTLPGSSEPVASPQARPVPGAASYDPDASKAGLKIELGVKDSSELHWASWSPVKPLSFRIPLPGEAVVEIEAKLLPAPSR